MMEFSGEFTVDGTPEELWKYFTDPDILQDCAPGCQSMNLQSPSELTASLAVGVGSVKPSFDVEGVVTECDRPNRLEIQASGEASRNSFEVVAWQELEDNGDGTTTVTWGADAEVSGIIASMGERALGSVADTLVNEFFEKLEGHVNDGTPAESKLQAASSEEVEAAAERSPPAAGGGVVDGALGAVAAVTGEDGPDIGSFLAGVALGVVGGTVLNRLRGRGRQPPAPQQSQPAVGDPQTQAPAAGQRQPQGSGGSSLLVLALTAALGAVGALAWNRSQSADDGSTAETVEPDTTPESTADTVGDVRENGESDQSGTGGHTPDLDSDDPLDRLESRP
jgi:carbon monoxide dehydrogenase subunit G